MAPEGNWRPVNASKVDTLGGQVSDISRYGHTATVLETGGANQAEVRTVILMKLPTLLTPLRELWNYCPVRNRSSYRLYLRSCHRKHFLICLFSKDPADWTVKILVYLTSDMHLNLEPRPDHLITGLGCGHRGHDGQPKWAGD